MVGELSYFLGLQVKQLDDGITVSQSTYAKNIIKRFGMQTSKTANTPMSTTTKLSRDDDGKPVDEKLYKAMIGSLLYLTASRPDKYEILKIITKIKKWNISIFTI